MKLVQNSARFIVGALFIFSGFIKLVDPTGTAIKLEEYFYVFANDFTPLFKELIPHAMFFSVLLSTLEVVLGISLLVLYKVKRTAWLLLVMILYFTFLTFYSAYFDKVTDCGCFGDAIPLDPWESFIKDVILTVLIIIIFIRRKKFQSVFDNKKGTIVVAVATVFSVAFGLHNIYNLPVIDFRHYAVGNNIDSLMNNGTRAEGKYLVDGEYYDNWKKEWNKNTPEFEYVVTKEAQPPTITDFSVTSPDGDDMTGHILEGNKLLIISQSLDYFNKGYLPEIRHLVKNLKEKEVKTIFLGSTTKEKFEEFNKEANLSVSFYWIDETVSKAMIRSNPGIMLLKDGVVKGKWHYRNIPEASEIKKLIGD